MARGNKGLKKKAAPERWKKNIIKNRKAAGQSYVSYSGETVAEIKFRAAKKCCRKKCCDVVQDVDQKILFTNFYAIGDKVKQDTYLAACMIPVKPVERVIATKMTPRIFNWKYQFTVEDSKYIVCKKIFMSVLQVSTKRLRVTN